MNAMLERIEAHEHSLRQFSADASHELKSPVANLRALVDTASIDDPDWVELRGRLAGESDRLRDLVDNLLFLATHQAGRPPGRMEQVSLDELLFAEAELLVATGSVRVDLNGVQPTELAGSAPDLSRLVRNLVDNAARHAASKVALSVWAETTAGQERVVLTVGDDGDGIAPEDRERVFERFTRLDDARARHDGGSGLGLAIVSYIAEGHAGTVTVGHSPLGGAEFRVEFG
jgi:signal transduction histidine kinase